MRDSSILSNSFDSWSSFLEILFWSFLDWGIVIGLVLKIFLILQLFYRFFLALIADVFPELNCKFGDFFLGQVS